MKTRIKRYWYIIPVIMSVVALVVAMASIGMAYTGPPVISNTLVGTADISYIPNADDVSLSWAFTTDEAQPTTGFTAEGSAAPLSLAYNVGDVFYAHVKAEMNTGGETITRALFLASFTEAVLKVQYSPDAGTTWVDLPENPTYTDYYYYGPVGGFDMIPSAYPITTTFKVTALTAGTTNFEVWAVQLP